jgi:hypothetical protein
VYAADTLRSSTSEVRTALVLNGWFMPLIVLDCQIGFTLLPHCLLLRFSHFRYNALRILLVRTG